MRFAARVNFLSLKCHIFTKVIASCSACAGARSACRAFGAPVTRSARSPGEHLSASSACADARSACRAFGAPVAHAVNDAFLLVEKSVEL